MNDAAEAYRCAAAHRSMCDSRLPRHSALTFVRILYSNSGLLKSKRLKDRENHLGRILKGENDQYDVEWVLGGRLSGCTRDDLVWTCAENEGMTYTSSQRRNKRKPVNFMEEVVVQDTAKKQKKQAAKGEGAAKKAAKNSDAKSKAAAPKSKPTKAAPPKKKPVPKRSGTSDTATTKNSQKLKVEVQQPATTSGLDLFEKHRREFERIFTRLEEKIDCFRHFSEEAPEQFEEIYDKATTEAYVTIVPANGVVASAPSMGTNGDVAHANATPPSTQATNSVSKSKTAAAAASNPYPFHPPFNWEMIRRRMNNGRYVLDRRRKEVEDRLELFAPYYSTLGKKKANRKKQDNKKGGVDTRVLYPKGVDWDLFQKDVFAMCDAGLSRQTPDDKLEDNGLRGSLSYTVKKLNEALQQAVERTGSRHAAEMAFADDRHKFALAVEASNTEAAMQSPTTHDPWRA